MSFIDAMRIGWRAIGSNRLRSGLTTLGLVIGVSSVIVLIAVGTPQDEVTGQADLTAVMACATDIIKAANTSLILVTKSTVPINTHLKLADLAHSLNPDLSIDIVSNPEFLREGSAVYDFMNPDRIIIGVGSSLAQEKSPGLDFGWLLIINHMLF